MHITGNSVEINWRLPTVAVIVGTVSYFLQGDEAAELLDQAELAKTGTVADFIIDYFKNA